MERHHSTLELVKHDETARAPERDWDATAFELDTSASAPQAVLDTSPQVAYNDSLPEVHEDTDDTTKERTPSHHTPKPGLKWMLIITASVVAVAIGIGVGIGIWRHREHGSHGPFTMTSPPAPSPTAPQNPAPKSSPNSTLAAQYILNDTSLAALVLSDGDRHLFFQDNNGLIRRVIRSASENQWTIDPSRNLSSSPKIHTPLAATTYNAVEIFDTDGYVGPLVIGLHYVSDSHILASSKFVQGVWTPDPTFGNGSTAVDTRSLSFCSLPGTGPTNNTYLNLGLLLYENPTGKVSALLQRVQKPTDELGPEPAIEWIDITSLESRSLPDDLRSDPDDNGATTTLYESGVNYTPSEDYTFSAPFTSAANYFASAIGALFATPSSDLPIMQTTYNVTYGTWSFETNILPAYVGYASLDYDSIRRSDIATFSTAHFIWINGTQPMIGPSPPPRPGLPKTPFPFTRLASATFQSITYLYHQINGTTIAEEQWNDIENFWDTPEYINVSDLSVQDSN